MMARAYGLLAAILAGLLGGCESLPKAGGGGAIQPIPFAPLAVIYHPYGPALVQTAGQPTPSFDSLPDRRIEVDTRLLRRSLIRTIFVRLDPDTLAQPDRLRRVNALVAHLGAVDAVQLQVVLQLDPRGLSSAVLTSAIDILRENQLQSLPGYRLAAGEPVLEYIEDFPPGFSLGPGIVLRRAPDSAVRLAPGVTLDHTGRLASVDVGQYADGNWNLPRESRTFRQRLLKATDAGAVEIRINAWNDFHSGAFLQPDRESGRQLLESLN